MSSEKCEISRNFFRMAIDCPIIGEMKGLTIDEIAEELGIPWKTAHKRIEKLGIKPLSYKAMYDSSVVEAIRNVPGRGRPPKPKAEEQEG